MRVSPGGARDLETKVKQASKEQEMKRDKEQSKKRIGRPSPAMVVAMTALIVALTGSAYAAISVPRNSIGTRQLKAKSVTNGKLANNSVTGGKVAPESLTGANINLAALGTVPQAANASNAVEAKKLDSHEAACPAHTTLIHSLCYETTATEAPNLKAAAEGCSAKGGYLPTPMQLYSVKGVLNLGTGVGSDKRFTDDVYTEETGTNYYTILVWGAGALEREKITSAASYMCVYPLVR
jgi:hypothetical protein